MALLTDVKIYKTANSLIACTLWINKFTLFQWRVCDILQYYVETCFFMSEACIERDNNASQVIFLLKYMFNLFQQLDEISKLTYKQRRTIFAYISAMCFEEINRLQKYNWCTRFRIW